MKKPLFIPFGEWLPDQPPLDNKGALSATNVLVNQNSYIPFPQLSTFALNTILARVQGAIVAQDQNGNPYNFAGDSTALYQMVSRTFVEVSRIGPVYGTQANDYWEFTQFGDRVIACNGISGGANLQSMSLGEANFVDLTAATAIGGRSIATVRDFVAIAGVNQGTSTSGIFAQRVRWSGINNVTTWTPDTATLSDFQDLVGDGGPCMKIIGGDYGVILQRRAIWRMVFVGSPLVFQFDLVQRNIGTLATQAAVGYQNRVFFLYDDGFYMFDGINVKPIGRGKVDQFFFRNADSARLQRVQATVHPTEKVVIWEYADTAAAANTLNKGLAYNWAFDKWTAVSNGVSLEFLTQHISAGGNTTLAAFVPTGTLRRFNAVTAMTAIVMTGELNLLGDNRCQIDEMRPLVEGLSASYTLQVLTRNKLTESYTSGTATAPISSGIVTVRAEGRYHRIKFSTAGTNIQFDNLLGVEITEFVPTGRR